jgi:hypothetical protein
MRELLEWRKSSDVNALKTRHDIQFTPHREHSMLGVKTTVCGGSM